MENKREICPYCGGTELVRGQQSGYAVVVRCKGLSNGRKLIHLICRQCGTVVRSYVEDPEYFAK